MKRLFILCLLLGILPIAAPAQEAKEKKQQWPVSVTLFSEAWSLPSVQLLKKPIHPGLTIGTAYRLREGRLSTVSLGGTLGYFYHKNFQNNVHFIASLGYEHNLWKGLTLGTALGLGYSHSFYPTPMYMLQDGEYKRATDWGKSTFMPSLDLSVGYTVGRKTAHPVTIFSKYQVLVEWPFAPENTFPVLPHTALHVGVRFYPFR